MSICEVSAESAGPRKWVATEVPLERPKPEGGFLLVNTRQLVAAWQACSPREFRVWLALHELEATRAANQRTRRLSGLPSAAKSNYHAEEVLRLIGGGGVPLIRRSCKALEDRGLVTARRGNVAFPTEASLPEQLEEQLRGIPKRVPIPRRLLRWLCGCSARSVMAAALGHVLRSMRYYSREKLCRARGRCAASWAAELFEVSTKSIERGRSVLVREGCLIKLDGAGPLRGKAKSLETRYGWHFVLNMLWQKPRAKSVPANSKPPPARIRQPPLKPGYAQT